MIVKGGGSLIATAMHKSIYEHFQSRLDLPVPLLDVKRFILQAGAAHVIRRYPVSIDPAVLRGMIRVYRATVPYDRGEPRIYADIAYSDQLHPFEQRLVCCKEMLHLLDGHGEHASNEAAVARLVRDVVIPEEMASLAGVTDNLKILHALAVLMPRAALAYLRDAHDQGKLSPADIGEIAQMPPQWIRFMLNDRWQELLHTVCGLAPSEEMEARSTQSA